MAVACIATSGAMARPASVNLDFNGSGNTLAATGFGNVYTLDNTHFNVGGGALTIQTQGGDTFGDYENDPDSAKNMFYSDLDVAGFPTTTLEARVHVTGLNVNFHGGGIWMGTDQDHYVRLGIFHNTFLTGGPLGVELLRENEDRWTGATPPGQGDDIVGNQTGLGGTSPQSTPIDAILRIVRNGNTVAGFFSTDNGATFLPAGSIGGFALPGDPQGNGSNTEENTALHPLNGLKVGVYAFGGPDPQTPANFAFDSLSASSTPEPASLGLIALAGGKCVAEVLCVRGNMLPRPANRSHPDLRSSNYWS
jgi:hypothetical protein